MQPRWSFNIEAESWANSSIWFSLSVSEKSQIAQLTSVDGWNPATVAELSTSRFFFGGKTSSKVPRHTDLEFAEERMFKTVDNPEGKDGWYLSNRLRMG